MPTVSVHIVTYNSEEEITNCLQSIFQQQYPIENIMLIDNNSKDKTLEKIQTYTRIEILRNINNNGFAGGHNQGIGSTSTDYVVVLNPDVVLHKDYISNIIKEMEEDKQVGMATGKLYRDSKNKILDSTGIIIKKNRRAFDRGAGEPDRGQFDTNKYLFGVSGAAAIYRREMIEEITINGQFFDETFFAYKEDVDVSWRAQLYGWKAMFVPSALAVHERGWKDDKKRKDIPLQIRKHSYINRYYCMLKNDQPIFLVKNLPFILFYEVLSFTYAVLREPKVLTAWKDFAKEFSNMMEYRKIIKDRTSKSGLKSVYSFFRGKW